MRDEKVEQAGADGFAFLIGNDQKVGRQRHDFKKDDEVEGVVHDHQRHHGGDEGVHEKPHG